MLATSERELSRHLSNRAGEYFQELRNGEVQVHLRSKRQRTNSTLYEFHLAGADCRYAVLVKSPPRILALRNVARERLPDRPRLCSQPPLEHKSRFEYLALATIEKHLSSNKDDRFAAVRMLDLLPDGSALVMEKAKGRSLRQWLLDASRFSLRGADREALGRALVNAGAWLKRFHQLPPLTHTQQRCVHRDEFLCSVEEFIGYLSGHRIRFCEQLRSDVAKLAHDVLPESLPRGLSHGDYAPWNILSEPCGRIRIIDTLARWQSPVYEDLAKFLFGMKLSQQQVWTMGHAYNSQQMAWFEQQFLEGYFNDEPIPYAQIRLFECQTILERWVAFVYASRNAVGWRRWAKESRRIVWELYVKKQISEMLRTIQRAAS